MMLEKGREKEVQEQNQGAKAPCNEPRARFELRNFGVLKVFQLLLGQP